VPPELVLCDQLGIAWSFIICITIKGEYNHPPLSGYYTTLLFSVCRVYYKWIQKKENEKKLKNQMSNLNQKKKTENAKVMDYRSRASSIPLAL
jgi:hypothetical protein